MSSTWKVSKMTGTLAAILGHGVTPLRMEATMRGMLEQKDTRSPGSPGANGADMLAGLPASEFLESVRDIACIS